MGEQQGNLRPEAFRQSARRTWRSPAALLVLLALPVLLLSAGLWASDPERDNRIVPYGPPELAPRLGDDAPAFSLRAYNEEIAVRLTKTPQVSLNHFVGFGAEQTRKAVLLAFAARWNDKSWKELAVFQRLYKKFKDSGLMILVVCIDRNDTQLVYESLDKEKVTFPVLRDRFQVVSRRYGISQLPTLFLIDKEGKIVSMGEAYQEDVESYLEEELKRILKE